MIQYNTDETTSKLILLYLLDKMECEVTEDSLVDVCYYENKWVTYFNFKIALNELVKANYINEHKISINEKYYLITPEGRSCLSYFYNEIPISIREGIGEFVKNNQMKYKRRQEYFSDCYKNTDNTYTVLLKIQEPAMTKLELRLIVDSNDTAKEIQKQWINNASKIYAGIIDTLL